MNIMKKTVFLAILGLACVFAAVGQTPVELDAAIQQASKDIDLKISGGPKVALLNLSSPTNDLSAYVLREMALVLEKNKKLTVMPRQNIDNALRQANLKTTSEVTDAAARELGKKIGADHVVVGFFEKMPNDSYRFRTRL
ncbi:MAG: CsgG/HfaB family protein, partial [Spirochaetaceae bacterium]|nr:CsgG/HfaB family protein [Spirochaetaceae bacterium]